jgi:hypothetical protein
MKNLVTVFFHLQELLDTVLTAGCDLGEDQVYLAPVLLFRRRIWIRMFLGLPDPDPLVRGIGTDSDADPSII